MVSNLVLTTELMVSNLVFTFTVNLPHLHTWLLPFSPPYGISMSSWPAVHTRSTPEVNVAMGNGFTIDDKNSFCVVFDPFWEHLSWLHKRIWSYNLFDWALNVCSLVFNAEIHALACCTRDVVLILANGKTSAREKSHKRSRKAHFLQEIAVNRHSSISQTKWKIIFCYATNLFALKTG